MVNQHWWWINHEDDIMPHAKDGILQGRFLQNPSISGFGHLGPQPQINGMVDLYGFVSVKRPRLLQSCSKPGCGFSSRMVSSQFLEAQGVP